MICSRCGNDVANGSAACPRCGTPFQAASGVPGSVPHGGAAAPRAGVGTPAFKFDAARWSRADRVTGIATLVLFVSLFLPWFGFSVIGISGSADALTAHGYMYLVLILCLAILAFLVMRAGFEEMPVRLPLTAGQALLAATTVNFVLVLIAFLIKPGGVASNAFSWRFGAFVGVIAAVAAAAPLAVPAIQARRTRVSS
jgi:hypothetical protein